MKQRETGTETLPMTIHLTPDEARNLRVLAARRGVSLGIMVGALAAAEMERNVAPTS